jgi:hypothetical protein
MSSNIQFKFLTTLYPLLRLFNMCHTDSEVTEAINYARSDRRRERFI